MSMIIVKHHGEIIAKARTLNVVDNYFRLKRSRVETKELILNRPILSTKFNITVVLEESNETWQKNQSIVFLKKVEPNK